MKTTRLKLWGAPSGIFNRVRFAADRAEDDADTPRDTSASAPSRLPAVDATTNSLPAHSSEAVPPASAIGVPDQVMSEGPSSAPDAAVRLSMKRSSDSSHSESETKRYHADHSMDDCDVGRSIERCREVCRRGETFLVDVNAWDCAFRDTLRACGSDGTTVACSSSGTTRELMSNESCLLDLLAAARGGDGSLQRKTIGKCARQHKRGVLGAVGHCEEFDPVLVQRAKLEEKDFIDKMGVYDVVPRSAAAEKACRVIRTRWVTVSKGSDDAPQLRARWVLHRSSVVVAVTNTSTSLRRLIWR